ncbi:hypothetical protein [Candidatus Palauibacter sp.]|uniref:hypothetical protein n=1 Tax=Candidatus Palauibacter sp. TaxID=3101350 RepID=UPI003B015801
MVTDATRRDVWSRLYDAERLRHYYAGVLSQYLTKKRRRQGYVTLIAGAGFFAGVSTFFGAPSVFGAIAGALAIVAVYMAGNGQMTALVERCTVLEYVSTECLYLGNETGRLWSDIEADNIDDAVVTHRLRELEGRGMVTQARIAGYGFSDDHALKKRVETTAGKILEEKYV